MLNPSGRQEGGTKSTLPPQLLHSQIHVFCFGHAASAGEGVGAPGWLLPSCFGYFRRHLTHSRFGGVQKGLCTWLFRDLWVLRGS